jgi:tetratricopeptide (TPR) repeat protein
VWRSADAAIGAYLSSWRKQRVEACEATRVRAEQSEELFDLRMRCLDDRLVEATELARAFGAADAVVVDSAVQASENLAPLSACADAEGLRSRVRPPSDPTAMATVAELTRELAAARVATDTGHESEARATLDRIAEPIRKAGYGPLVARASLLEGEDSARAGDYKTAAERMREAAWTGIASHDEDTAIGAMAHLVEITGYRLADAEQGRMWDRMAEAHLSAHGSPPRGEAWICASRGTVARAQGRYAEAKTHLEKALLLERRALGDKSPEVASTLADLAYTQRQLGDFEGARDAIVQAISIREEAFGKGHPLVAAARSQLGAVDYGLDRLDESLDVLLAALKTQEETLGPDHLETGYTLNRIGNVYMARGDEEEAARVHERVLALGQKRLGNEHPEVGLAHMNLAIDLRALGRVGDAERELGAATRILEKGLGKEYPYLATVKSELGTIRCAEGRGDEGKKLHLEALELAKKTLGQDHPDLVPMLVRVGEDALDAGDTTRATASFRRAVEVAEQTSTPYADLAAARFGLARALWSNPAERARATELATRARDGYRSPSSRDRRERAAIGRWLVGPEKLPKPEGAKAISDTPR